MGNIGTYLKNPRVRLGLDVLIVVLIYVVHWYIPVILIALAMLFISRYYEGILFGLLIDLLYAPTFLALPKLGIAFLLLFVILEWFIKGRIRLYARD